MKEPIYDENNNIIGYKEDGKIKLIDAELQDIQFEVTSEPSKAVEVQ